MPTFAHVHIYVYIPYFNVSNVYCVPNNAIIYNYYNTINTFIILIMLLILNTQGNMCTQLNHDSVYTIYTFVQVLAIACTTVM